MQQHPIPQNISSYEFRLIGDMTLKQFLQLLAGGAVGFIFYSTNLPGIIKWPFILFFVLLGVGFAFMPLEGRPLDKWLLAFIKASYSPTQFIWKKSPSLPDYFTFKPNPKKDPASPVKKTAQAPVSLQTNSQPAMTPEPIDEEEQKRISQVISLFSQESSPKKPIAKLIKSNQPKIISSSFQILPLKPVKIDPKQATKTTQGSKFKTIDPQPEPAKKVPPSNILSELEETSSTIKGTTNPDLPFPSPPERPNVLVGMVLSMDGRIVENAVIEIRNQEGHPVRATKTNKLGQFFSVTPLKNGSYSLEIEKDGLSFDIITVSLEGEILQPLEIRAKNSFN